jgi:hypothetical protein
MSWFGGSKEPEQSSESSFNMDDSGGGGYAPSGGGGGGGGGSSMAEFQQFAAQIQQQVVIQQAITDMSEKAFMKCLTAHKDTKLTGREVACVYASTNKWLDANEYLVGRLAKKGQNQQQQGGY